MKAIIFEATMLVLVVGFVIFLARDDRKNRLLREEEDRQKALQEEQPKMGEADD
jgi:hypothetical protein